MIGRSFALFIITLFVGLPPAQKVLPANRQTACENELIKEADAHEVTEGPEYEALREVTVAFGRDKPPRLYIFSEGGAAIYYIAGSAHDGRGKFLLSRKFVELLDNPLAVKGGLAHEMAHLILDFRNPISCDDYVLSDPFKEQAVDALAADNIGFETVRAYLLRIKELSGKIDYFGAGARLDALDRAEAGKEKKRAQ